ncbi:MAG TPA: manganese efflux pump MntP family protein [Burkholderiaceae bacterium]
MNALSTLAIAMAMSTDAFAAAVGKGAALHKPRWAEALRTGAIFGAIEALTPLLGWCLGKVAAPYVEAWDHWLAFILLAGLGVRMIYAGMQEDDEEEPAGKRSSHSLLVLAATGFATSIDAMVVGAGLALLDANIVLTAAAIGLATFTMVTLGVMLGRVLGGLAGKRAEMAGGVVLIVLGSLILYRHLSVPAQLAA